MASTITSDLLQMLHRWVAQPPAPDLCPSCGTDPGHVCSLEQRDYAGGSHVVSRCGGGVAAAITLAQQRRHPTTLFLYDSVGLAALVTPQGQIERYDHGATPRRRHHDDRMD